LCVKTEMKVVTQAPVGSGGWC